LRSTLAYATDFTPRAPILAWFGELAESLGTWAMNGRLQHDLLNDDEWNRRGSVVQRSVSMYSLMQRSDPNRVAWNAPLAEALVEEARWLTDSGQLGAGLHSLRRAAGLLEELGTLPNDAENPARAADVRSSILDAIGGASEPPDKMALSTMLLARHSSLVSSNLALSGELDADDRLGQLGLAAVFDPVALSPINWLLDDLDDAFG
jgi:hypothetical protein